MWVLLSCAVVILPLSVGVKVKRFKNILSCALAYSAVALFVKENDMLQFLLAHV